MRGCNKYSVNHITNQTFFTRQIVLCAGLPRRSISSSCENGPHVLSPPPTASHFCVCVWFGFVCSCPGGMGLPAVARRCIPHSPPGQPWPPGQLAALHDVPVTGHPPERKTSSRGGLVPVLLPARGVSARKEMTSVKICSLN